MIQYDKNNYGGHGWSHIISVIGRSFELAQKFNLDINPNIVYVVASYHDIGYRKDPDNHEQVSSEMFLQDETYKVFIQDVRDLLKKAEEFKNRYCEVNHITSRYNRVCDEQGEVGYIKILSISKK